MSLFSERLEEARVTANTTINELCELVGISRSTYCNYRDGRREPNLQILAKLANALDCSIDFLLNEDADETCYLNYESKQLVREFSQLSKTQKYQVLGYIEGLKHIE